jgi:NRAMP (natural resistance-associated macrophage protein)-like metal ion transporter
LRDTFATCKTEHGIYAFQRYTSHVMAARFAANGHPKSEEVAGAMNLPDPASRLLQSFVLGLKTWLRDFTSPLRQLSLVFLPFVFSRDCARFKSGWRKFPIPQLIQSCRSRANASRRHDAEKDCPPTLERRTSSPSRCLPASFALEPLIADVKSDADSEDEQQDPLRTLFASGDEPAEDPPQEQLEKSPSTHEAATGTPPAGESVLEEARRGGVAGLLQVLGPGLITGASDDDPSGIGTYSQAGSQFGFGLLWLALFTFPLMIAVQEACARIGLHTGVGLGTSLRRKFPTWIVAVCICALFVANTINIGADLGAVAAGGSLLSGGHVPAILLVIPIGLMIVVMQLRLSYSLIFRIFKWLTLALFAYIITVFLVHPPLVATLRATIVPHIELNGAFLSLVVAILGTTISPYLFFWQASSEVDELRALGQLTEAERQGVTRRELTAARIDVSVGMLFSQSVMYCIILTGAVVLNAHGHTNIQTAQQAAEALKPLAGPAAFILFSLGLIGTGLLAIPVLAGSAAYAVKELLGIRGDLSEKAQYRPTFYGIVTLAVVLGVAMNFLHIDPIKALVVTAIINGMVAPPIMVLIALLARDRSVMGYHRSGRLSSTLVWIATILMGIAALALVGSLMLG